jgi:phage shock protein E
MVKEAGWILGILMVWHHARSAGGYRRGVTRTRLARLVGGVLATLAVLSTPGCGASSTAAPATSSVVSPAMQMSMPTVTPAPASTLLDPAEFAAAMNKPGMVTIDVHVPFEGKLNQSDLMIPYDQIAEHVGALPADRSTPLAIYCRSGNMSAIAAPVLAGLGFTDIVELRGGMNAWVSSGRTLITTE